MEISSVARFCVSPNCDLRALLMIPRVGWASMEESQREGATMFSLLSREIPSKSDLNEKIVQKELGLFRVECPNYHSPALVRMTKEPAASGKRVQMCTVRTNKPCMEACLPSARSIG